MLSLLLAALVAAVPAPPTPLGRVLVDADHDAVPDRVGQTVTVAGRASVASGRLGTDTGFYLQDATGGLRMRAPTGPVVARGDSVVATGRLAFDDGAAVLEWATVRIVPGARRPPVPLPYDTADPERVEGRLVAIEGTVAGLRPGLAGDALLLSLPDGTMLVAFVFKGRDEALPLSDHAPGDRVRVVGVAGQYDRQAPFRDSYQIYPRTPDDVARAGIPASMYRKGALGTLALLGLALLWAAVLRRQVARRVADLQTSEDRYRVVVERASDAVFVHNFDEAGAELNDAAREAFGLDRGAAVPPMIRFIDPADHEAAYGHRAQLAATGHARTDLRVRRTDGEVRIYEFDSQPVEIDGRLRVLSLARDVGARRAYEQALVASREAAEEALRVKSAFLSNMSHEIRTPLTAVLGYAEILADEVGDEQRDLVTAIEAGGRRLLATLNSVLDLARLDAHRETLRPVDLDLVGHVRQSVALFDGLAGRKGLRLDFASEAPTLTAHLDVGALDRILTNLVGNAIKFTDAGAVTVTLAPEGDSAVLVVADTGVGMSEAFLPEVFAEFRQESEGHARSHEGSGLGLSITRKLAELMGGTIEIASASGCGTTVTVTLPLGTAEAPAEAPQRLEALVSA